MYEVLEMAKYSTWKDVRTVVAFRRWFRQGFTGKECEVIVIINVLHFSEDLTYSGVDFVKTQMIPLNLCISFCLNFKFKEKL